MPISFSLFVKNYYIWQAWLEKIALSTDTPKIIIDLNIQVSYKSQQAMSLTLQYIGVIKTMGADIPTSNTCYE